ncbi:MAG: TolC family protein [Bacteroidaceae bacterium]|nr:TolC family protein [Bacteroidaceae bacterium]
MKKILLILALVTPIPTLADSIDEILEKIAHNNLELQMQQNIVEAQQIENKAENVLGDLSVTYSSFYEQGEGSDHGSEFVATQAVDFPTQYLSRHKQAELENASFSMQYLTAKRDILLKAQLLCLDIIYLNQEKELLDIRLDNANRLEELYKVRFDAGDANALDVNRVKMERMNVQTLVAVNNAAHRTAMQSLLTMNGNKPLEFNAKEYPQIAEIRDFNVLKDEVMDSDPDLMSLSYATQAADEQVSISQQEWLPKLELGFRRNTDNNKAMNGFVVGGSIPLFSNRHQVKISKVEAINAQLVKKDAELHIENSLMSLYNEMLQLKETMQSYDTELMYSSLELLQKALDEGEISIIEYFIEAESIYNKLLTRMEIENQYRKALANIYKNRLID